MLMLGKICKSFQNVQGDSIRFKKIQEKTTNEWDTYWDTHKNNDHETQMDTHSQTRNKSTKHNLNRTKEPHGDRKQTNNMSHNIEKHNWTQIAHHPNGNRLRDTPGAKRKFQNKNGQTLARQNAVISDTPQQCPKQRWTWANVADHKTLKRKFDNKTTSGTQMLNDGGQTTLECCGLFEPMPIIIHIRIGHLLVSIRANVFTIWKHPSNHIKHQQFIVWNWLWWTGQVCWQ